MPQPARSSAPQPHRLDPIFTILATDEKFRKMYLRYLQKANNAFGTVYYEFAQKRKSKKVDFVILDNGTKLDVKYKNEKNENVDGTRDINSYVLLHFYEKNVMIRAADPNQINKALKDTKKFGADLKHKSLDFFINNNFYVLKELPTALKKIFTQIYNDTFATNLELATGVDKIVSQINLLKMKRDFFEHYPQNNSPINEIKTLSILFNFLLPKEASELKSAIYSTAVRMKIADGNLLDLDTTLAHEIKTLQERKNGLKLFVNSKKLTEQREKLVQIADDIKANPNLSEVQKTEALKKHHAKFVVHKSKRKVSHYKIEKIKTIKETLFETHEDKKRDKKLIEFINHVGEKNFKAIATLFTKQKEKPGFNDILDLNSCAYDLFSLFNYYFTTLKTAMNVLPNNDNFSAKLKEWCLQNRKEISIFNELIFLRNKIDHNTNCFLIPNKIAKRHYTLAEIADCVNTAFKTITGKEVLGKLAHQVKTNCQKYNYSVIYNLAEKKPIKKITKWDKETLALYGKDARAKNSNLVLDNRRIINNLLLQNIKTLDK